MALLLKNLDCHACGARHNFGLDGAGWDAEALYEYVCPQTAERASMKLPLATTAEESRVWPQEAVTLRPAGSKAATAHS